MNTVPHLVAFKSEIAYLTSTGMEATAQYEGPNPFSVVATAHNALLDLIRELTRIGCIAGLEQQIKDNVNEAAAAVAQWREQEGGT